MVDTLQRKLSVFDRYKRRVLTSLLLIGGIIALLDGLFTDIPVRASIRFFAAVVSVSLLIYLWRTSNLRMATIGCCVSSGIVFLGDFVIYGDPIYLAIGFSVPLGAALLLRATDALWVLIAYVVVGLGTALLFEFGVAAELYAAPSILERCIAALCVICAIAGPTIWLQRILFKTEREQEQQRKRFETISDSEGNAFFEVDASGCICFARGGLFAELGYCPEDLVGRNYREFIVESESTGDGDALPVGSPRSPCDYDVRIRDAKGVERWGHLSGGRVGDGDNAGSHTCLYALRDIHASIEHRNHLFELSRIESLGSLCGGLAHDFNNLLTVIGIHALNVEDESTRNELLTAQQRAADLTAGLMTFARRQTYRESDVDLGEFLKSSKDLIEQLVPANTRCEWQIESGRHFVRIDAAQLQQVLINLVTNATQAMPEGGLLKIGLATTRIDPETQKGLGASRTGNFKGHLTDGNSLPKAVAEITVTDTGHGMDSNTLKRAVEPFFTMKPRGTGTGLGLATVHGAIKRAGGSLCISSQPGQGAEVSVSLPLSESHESHKTSRAVERSSSGKRGLNVMLVEDNDLIRASVAELLSAWGHETAVFGSAEVADERLQENDFDLLITDIVLPGMSGVELARLAVERQDSLKVILITGYQTSDISDLLGDSVRLLSKPFQPDQLNEVIDQLVVIASIGGASSQPS